MKAPEVLRLAPGLHYFDADAVVARLVPADCIAAMRDALIAASSGRVVQTPRTIVPLPDDGGFALMPGALADSASAGVKVTGRFAVADDDGEVRHRRTGVFLLFDRKQGELRAIVDAISLTDARTAATTVAATQALARPGRKVVTLLGAGALAQAHALAFASDPDVAEIIVWGRNPERAGALVQRLADQCRTPVRRVADAAQAVAMADVVCTLTSASQPVLRGAWLREGQHLNAVGSSTVRELEIDTEAVRRGRVFVDSREAAAKAAGELLKAREEGAIGGEHVIAEVGDVLAGRSAGRRTSAEITLFKSLGLFAQDCAAAALLLEGLPEQSA